MLITKRERNVFIAVYNMSTYILLLSVEPYTRIYMHNTSPPPIRPSMQKISKHIFISGLQMACEFLPSLVIHPSFIQFVTSETMWSLVGGGIRVILKLIYFAVLKLFFFILTFYFKGALSVKIVNFGYP